ncbi:TerD family protein [Streptomyces mobaraensis NBRC 13819 = DSM 40847]|uniref:Export associated protein n=1 Tax=Streptomyces mobaraensis (strain ATCC 29032 / DSM 40847 / JCM 4168 / NBRC 13819 / NCIMB 11159 / IPCR 16-22) TaxID=1223523 RepID=M3C4L2_STRM1|nr:TerD family protein [Streptomyces mobaraensis]EME98890.1 export associated protein [Streptomyces mobaraensis NBRC 13819 = DSM 40847]QTT73300.1 TerD family protein [Streptomyces mobaraensis NBRC 13819 = DSM 40847]
MTAELVRGQNHPLTGSRLEIRVSAGDPVVVGAALGGADGRVPDAGRVGTSTPGSPRLPGVEVPAGVAAAQRLSVELDALPDSVHRVHVLLALPPGGRGPARFGATAAPFVALAEAGGDDIASFTVTELDAETALVALELYRRQGAWRVRAVGQGYAGGLAELFRDLGVDRAAELAAGVEAEAAGSATVLSASQPSARHAGSGCRHAGTAVDWPAQPAVPEAAPAAAPQAVPAPETPSPAGPVDYRHPRRRATEPPQPAPATPAARPGTPPEPVAGDAAGWTMEERLYNQVWGMFEDLARSTAAYRSAVGFAESRLEKELDRVLSDPATRVGPAADAAREAARAKHGGLVEQARAVLDRDLAQLTAEAEVVEHALPPALARWDSPVWHAYQAPLETPMALRLGDLHLPERRGLRIPMLVRLPLQRGLWVDCGRATGSGTDMADPAELRRLAMDCAVAHAARLLAVHPVGEFAVHVLDPAGSASAALAPLVEHGVLVRPPVAGAQGVAAVLTELTRRVDLVQMAVRSGAADALPPDLDTAEQLLIVNDFPHGFDDRAVTQLRYLADEGPAVGVHLMMVADREDSRGFGPVLDPLWRSLLRITPVPDDHLADPWVRHAWTYEPSLAPAGSDVVRQVLWQVGQARRAYGL